MSFIKYTLYRRCCIITHRCSNRKRSTRELFLHKTAAGHICHIFIWLLYSAYFPSRSLYGCQYLIINILPQVTRSMNCTYTWIVLIQFFGCGAHALLPHNLLVTTNLFAVVILLLQYYHIFNKSFEDVKKYFQTILKYQLLSIVLALPIKSF